MPAPRPVALVTGASAGIGREIARILARDHDLILTARREAELRALAAELEPATCHIVPADLADPAAPRALMQTIGACGLAIDVLVNNAGFGDHGAFARTELAKFLRMIQVNVAALTELTGLVLPAMLERRSGRILNVGSVAGFQPGPLMAVYYATKAYVNSFSEALASELAGTRVTVTCLAPGPTESEFDAAAGMTPRRASAASAVMDARSVAEAGVRGLMNGQRMVVTGLRNKLLIFAERFLPRGMVISAVRRMQEKRKS